MIIKSFKTNIVIIMITILNVLIAQSGEQKSLTGQTAPNWALKTSDGKFEFLNNYAAPFGMELLNDGQERKIVIQSFFASWCGPCIKEIGELEKVKTTYAGKPVQFFLVNLTDYFRKEESKKYRDAPNAMELLKEKGLTNIAVLEDNRGIVARQYNVANVLPRLFVIDKYQTVQMDALGLCPSCIQDEVGAVLDRLMEE